MSLETKQLNSSTYVISLPLAISDYFGHVKFGSIGNVVNNQLNVVIKISALPVQNQKELTILLDDRIKNFKHILNTIYDDLESIGVSKEEKEHVQDLILMLQKYINSLEFVAQQLDTKQYDSDFSQEEGIRILEMLKNRFNEYYEIFEKSLE